MTPEPEPRADALPAPAGWVEQAVAAHETRLVAYAERFLDAHRARDAVQETFLRLVAANPEDARGRIAAWLFTVCRRVCLDAIRKERRMKTADVELLDLRPGAGPSPDAAAETRDAATAAMAALARLPAKEREVMELRFRHGFSYAEIAEVTGHTATNVGFLLHVGMKQLRALMQQSSAPRTGGAL
ncbi:MAG: hypothetical protein HMLKMBBP_00800 [Planctomycetes bacterium]|nr:hypothetical protein [Planctomycetota bacterium]